MASRSRFSIPIGLCLLLPMGCGQASTGANPDLDSSVSPKGNSDDGDGPTLDDGGGATGSESGVGQGGTIPGDASVDGGSSIGRSDGGGAGASDAGKGEGPLPGGAMAFPPPNGQNVCPDPPLRITFSGPPKLGTSGKVQRVRRRRRPWSPRWTWRRRHSATPSVERPSTRFARRTSTATTRSSTSRRTRSRTGRPTTSTSTRARSSDRRGRRSSITDTTSWRFTTAAAAPSNLSSLAVALNGSGRFCSVQGAIDALPAGNTSAATITIAARASSTRSSTSHRRTTSPCSGRIARRRSSRGPTTTT